MELGDTADVKSKPVCIYAVCICSVAPFFPSTLRISHFTTVHLGGLSHQDRWLILHKATQNLRSWMVPGIWYLDVTGQRMCG